MQDAFTKLYRCVVEIKIKAEYQEVAHTFNEGDYCTSVSVIPVHSKASGKITDHLAM